MAEDPIARLRRLDVCAVSDACDRLKLAPAITGIVPQTVHARIAGRITTVKVAAGEKQGGSARHLCTAAIEASEPGGVVVIEQTTGIDAAGWGGILSRAAKTRDLSGAIVEGPTRDVDEAREIGFPVYARGTTARTARGRIHEADTNCPVHIGGQRVEPGEYVLADFIGHRLYQAGEYRSGAGNRRDDRRARSRNDEGCRRRQAGERSHGRELRTAFGTQVT